MPETHQLTESVFWHTMRSSRKAPLIERGSTQEVDYPYRHGKAVVFRLPLTTLALAVGKWAGREAREKDAILKAIGGRDLQQPMKDVREWG